MKINNIYKTKSDKIFLKRLSKWIFEQTGNINISQRLNCMVIQGRIGVEGGNKC